MIFSLFHVVVSVNPKVYLETRDQAAVIRDVRQRALGEARRNSWGEYGGISVVHLYRDRFENNTSEWGPHVHLVCPGVKVGTTTVKATGLVVKVVRTTNPGGVFATYRGERTLRLMIYLLDHASAIPRSPAMVSFGGARRTTPRKKSAPPEDLDNPVEGDDVGRDQDCYGSEGLS